MDFRGKKAIVTGGTRGIGKSIVKKLWQLGCNVIATGTNISSKKFLSKQRLRYLELDLSDNASIYSFIDKVSKLKQIDILVNNAGINIIEPIDKLEKDNWDKIIQVNLTGPMLLSKQVALMMKKRKRGRVLNVSSIWGVIAKEKRNSYAASKTGLIGLTRAMSLDLAPFNILVNTLCPGFTLTELTKASLSKSEIEELSAEVPLKRFAKVEEIANAAAFLCSDLNTYITGQTLVIDGGFTVK